jgi:PAS domain-containing protein
MSRYLGKLNEIAEMQSEMFRAIRMGVVEPAALRLMAEYCGDVRPDRSPDKFTADVVGLCTSVGDSICAEMGWPEKRAKGIGFANLIHPDDTERVINAWLDAVAAHSAFSVEYRIAGRSKWPKVRNVAFPVVTPDGKFAGMEGTITAI